MKTIIKIDRKTIMKNPTAGRNNYYIPKGVSWEFEYTGKSKPKWLLKNAGVFISEGKQLCSHKYKWYEIKGSITNQELIIELTKMIQTKQVTGLNLIYKNDIEQVFTQTPEPDYLYKYKNTKVECNECKKMVPVNDINNDYCDDMPITICPKCQKWNTFDYEYEKISKVLKE